MYRVVWYEFSGLLSKWRVSPLLRVCKIRSSFDPSSHLIFVSLLHVSLYHMSRGLELSSRHAFLSGNVFSCNISLFVDSGLQYQTTNNVSNKNSSLVPLLLSTEMSLFTKQLLQIQSRLVTRPGVNGECHDAVISMRICLHSLKISVKSRNFS